MSDESKLPEFDPVAYAFVMPDATPEDLAEMLRRMEAELGEEAR